MLALLLFACDSYDHRLVQQARCDGGRWHIAVWTLDDADTITFHAQNGDIAAFEPADPFPALSTCAADSGFTDRPRQPIRQGWVAQTNLACDDATWAVSPEFIDIQWADGADRRTWITNCPPIGFTGELADTGF